MASLTHRSGALTRSIQSLVSGPPAAVVPATNVLASLIDLRGSVDLADVLSRRPASLADTPLPFSRGAEVRRELMAIEADLSLRLASPFTDRPRLPDPDAMHAALSKAAGSPAEQRAALGAVAATFRDRITSLVGRAREQVAEVRALIADDLAAASPETARLEALDGVLTAATTEGVSRLLARVGIALEQAVVRDLGHSLKALPGGVVTSAEQLRPWFAEDGWVHSHVERIDQVSRAVFGHERAVLEALVARGSQVAP